MASYVNLMVVDIKERQVNKSSCLDAVVTITCTISVLHLRSIGVTTNSGVTFPTINRGLITSAIRAVDILQIHINQVTCCSVVVV